MRLFRWAALAVISVLLAAGGRAPAQAADTVPCAIVFGGGGSVTGNKEADDLWFAMNSATSKAVAAELTARGYRVELFVSNISGMKPRFDALYFKMRDTRCDHVVEISSANGETPGPPPAKTFGFSVQVLHFDPSPTNPRAIVVVGDFTGDYQYPLTAESMESLYPSDVGRQIAADIDDAKTLKKAS